MSDLDLDGLAALAQAATPGPFHVTEWEGEWEVAYVGGPGSDFEGEPLAFAVGISSRADAAFIAACDPDTILALRERVREVEAILNGRPHDVTEDEYALVLRFNALGKVLERAEARIAELEAEVTDKNAEFVRMENAWRRECESLRGERPKRTALVHKDQYDSVLAERDRLRTGIAAAPHDNQCPAYFGDAKPCNCWQAALLCSPTADTPCDYGSTGTTATGIECLACGARMNYTTGTFDQRPTADTASQMVSAEAFARLVEAIATCDDPTRGSVDKQSDRLMVIIAARALVAGVRK